MNRRMPAAIILSAGLGILVGFSFRNRNLHGDLTPIPRGPDEGQETTGSPANTPPNGEWPSWTGQTPLEIIAKLRAAGCPDRYVEDIVIAEINKKNAQMLIAQQTYGLSLPISAQSRVSQIRSNRLSELTRLLGPKVTETDALIGLPYIDPYEQITGPQRIVADVLRRKASMLSGIQAV